MPELIEYNSPILFDLVPSEIENKIIEVSSLKQYFNGQLIHNRGDQDLGLSIVRRGAIKAGVFANDGSYILTAILGPGQTFGEFTLFADLPRVFDVTAFGDTEIYKISKPDFEKVFWNEPRLNNALLRISITRCFALTELYTDARASSLSVRIAKLLVTISDRTSSLNEINLSQTELASALGVSRVATGKILKQFECKDFIEINYRKIKLTNKHSIMDWINENSPSVIHSE